MTPVRGEGLDPAARVEVVNTRLETLPAGASWALRGVTSNLRYTTRDEKGRLAAVEPALGGLGPAARRSGRTPPDLRRRLAPYVYRSALSPPIARRLHHSRDLGEPFDFITWFDYAPEYEHDFDALLAELHASEEWTYVAREVDIRLVPRARVRDLTSGWGRAFNI
jgi:hypothetical protein